MNEPPMVDLPWVDGTTRTVPEGTVYEAKSGLVRFARVGGYSLSPETIYGQRTHPHFAASAAVRIFTEAPEPPVKVDVPTGLGAIVSLSLYPHKPGYVLTREGWLGLSTGTTYGPSVIAEEFRKGARVLFEGVDEDKP